MAKRRPLMRRVILAVVLLAWGGTAFWHTHKPLPPGAHVASDWAAVATSDLKFIADITAADAYSRPILSQAIFDESLAVIRNARRFLVLDYFLLNGHRGAVAGAPSRALSGELRDAVLDHRRLNAQLQVLMIVDPINEVYGSQPSTDFALLRAAGVDIVTVNLDALRDSNFVYSSLWRLAMRWWAGSGRGKGWLPNPLDESDTGLTLGSWARLLNFKANHRKVIIADDGGESVVAIVSSANPHDASSTHSNVALRLTGAAALPLLESELAIARATGWRGDISLPAMPPPAGADARAQILTEGAIGTALLAHIAAAAENDSIDIAMFYLSHRRIVEALLAAARRGAAVRLILDPNKDAFGREKNGIPNRPVASELVSASDGAIHVRWYRTHGEQFHAKLVMIYDDERVWLTLGSANLTRRNLNDYNLEANVAVDLPRGSQLAVQMLDYFDVLWSNRAGLGVEYTADFDVYADPAQSHYWLYRFMEATGLSTF
jgi:phosphatidylserine/phosphatidylglycerophosphate/cardiolipin synthase-like enzyme